MLAGYIDAIGFIKLGGVFVSFMSGNSTRLAVGIIAEFSIEALLPGLVILLFIAGVVAGTVIGHYTSRWRMVAILSFVSFSLFLAAAAGEAHALSGALLMALAMGAVNTVFYKENGERIGLTYMTGTLVKVGQSLAEIFWGGSKLAWLRHAFLWFALVTGACLGAFSFRLTDMRSLWLAVVASIVLTAFSATRLVPRAKRP